LITIFNAFQDLGTSLLLSAMYIAGYIVTNILYHSRHCMVLQVTIFAIVDNAKIIRSFEYTVLR